MKNYRAFLFEVVFTFNKCHFTAIRQTEKVFLCWPCTVSPVNGKGKQRYIFMELTLIIRTHFDKLVEGMKGGMMRI